MKTTFVAEYKGQTFTRSSATRVYESVVIVHSDMVGSAGAWSWHTTRDYAEKAAQTQRKGIDSPSLTVHVVDVVAYPFSSEEAKAARKASGKTS